MTRHADRLNQVQLMLALENQVQPRVQRQLSKEVRQLAAVVGTWDGTTTALLSTVSDRTISYRPDWIKLLSRHYLQTGAVFGLRLFQLLGYAERKDFRDTFRLAMERFIGKWALAKARAITQTTRQVVQDLILTGVNAGLGTRDIARSIRGQLTGIGRLNPTQRADVISRTETHSAANFAQVEAVRALDLPRVEREWLAVEDARTRETHAAADGQRVGMDEPFIVGGARLMYPGDPNGPAEEVINCRCVTAALVPEGEG